jgi:PAS domain S-box-containing protein
MTDPNFHSPEAHARYANRIYHGLFADSPNAYLVMTPDLVIINGNTAYLDATGMTRDELASRYIFDVFPDNPTDPNATGVRNLTASFIRARDQRRRDTLPLQRYDLCHNGVWTRCFWYPDNWPILDDDGTVVAIIHHTKPAKVPHEVGDLVEQTRRLLDTTTAIANDLQAMVERFDRSTTR